MEFVKQKFQVCFICKKVTKCHVLFRDDIQEVLVCLSCDQS